MHELDIYTSGAQHLIQKSVAENMCSGFSKVPGTFGPELTTIPHSKQVSEQ